MRENMTQVVISVQRGSCMPLLAIMLFAALGFSQEPNKAKDESIRGTVVAENVGNRFMACYHVCGLTVLVRLDGREKPEYAVVVLSFMDDRQASEKGPHWKLVEKRARWEFRATKGDPVAVVLKQFATTKDLKGVDTTESTRLSEWLPLKGAENEQLPYGSLVQSYSVGVGKVKSIK